MKHKHTALLLAILKEVTIMADNVANLQAAVTALQTTNDDLTTKVTESNATLAGLSQAVLDLTAQLANIPVPESVQPAIDALTAQATDINAKAQATLASLAAAEDAADDQLPP